MSIRGGARARRFAPVGRRRVILAGLVLALATSCLLPAGAAPTASGESLAPASADGLLGVEAGGQVVGVSSPGEASPAGLAEAVTIGASPSATSTPIVVSVAEHPVLTLGTQGTAGAEAAPTPGEGGSRPPSAPGTPSGSRDAAAAGAGQRRSSASAASTNEPSSPPVQAVRPRRASATRPRASSAQARPQRAPATSAARPSHPPPAPAGAGAPAATLPRPSAPAPEAQGSSGPLQTIGRALPLPVPDWSKPVILALLALALALAARAELQGRRARRLEAQRGRLLGDLDAMQAALVPEVPEDLGDAAVSVAYRPAEGPAAGGDFYDVFVPSPGKVAIILGDVTGHGHESLTHAALTRYTVRAYLQAGLTPRAALTLAGRALEDPSCERFATVAVAVYDGETSVLTYALAGHPPPILQGVEVIDPGTACSSPPLGWSIPTGRRESVVALPAGASACFFSDGLIEAQCELAGERRRLGRERLAQIAGRLGDSAAAQELLATVCAEASATPDDLSACILFSRTAHPVQAVQIEELEADERALARGRARAFLDGLPLAPGEVDEAIELAVPIASTKGSAVFRVELREADATVTVGPPSPHLPPSPPAPPLAAGTRGRLRLVSAG